MRPWMPAPRWPVNLLCLDTETTGLSPDKHQVIEIAAVLANSETLAEIEVLEVSVLLREGSEVHARALQVNGIDPYSREFLKRAKPGSVAVAQLIELARGADVVLGHNVDFDLRFLAAEARAAGLLWPSVRSECTKLLAKSLVDSGKIENAKLATLCSHYGICNAGAHRALTDVRRTLQVYARLRPPPQLALDPKPTRPEQSVDEIHAARMREALPNCRACGKKLVDCGHHWSNAEPGAFSFPPSPPPPESDPGTRGRMEAARLATARWTKEDWAMEELVAPVSMPSTDPELKRARPSREPVQLGLKTE